MFKLLNAASFVGIKAGLPTGHMAETYTEQIIWAFEQIQCFKTGIKSDHCTQKVITQAIVSFYTTQIEYIVQI